MSFSDVGARVLVDFSLTWMYEGLVPLSAVNLAEPNCPSLPRARVRGERDVVWLPFVLVAGDAPEV